MNPFDPDYKPQIDAPTAYERGRARCARKLAKRNDKPQILIRRDAAPTADQKQAAKAKTAKIKAGSL